MMKIKYLVCFICCLACSPLALAKDVSAQQAGVEYAQNEMDSAEQKYQNKLRRVADSEKKLESVKKELADNRQQLQAAQEEKDAAQKRLTRAQELLDQAWQ
jgi:septal ring factor EnvC (AmiA/AmiB activator)